MKQLSLAQITVTLSFPKTWGDKECDLACDILSDIDLPDQIKQVVQQRLNEHGNAFKGVKVTVSE